jgi:hypothetical protein
MVLPFSITISPDQKKKSKYLVSVFYGFSMKEKEMREGREEEKLEKEGLCDAVP